MKLFVFSSNRDLNLEFLKHFYLFSDFKIKFSHTFLLINKSRFLKKIPKLTLNKSNVLERFGLGIYLIIVADNTGNVHVKIEQTKLHILLFQGYFLHIWMFEVTFWNNIWDYKMHVKEIINMKHGQGIYR